MTRTIEEHARAVLYGCNACTEHHSGVEWADVAEPLCAYEGCYCQISRGREDCGSYCDRIGWAILRLNDGRFAALWETEDSTGHG